MSAVTSSSNFNHGFPTPGPQTPTPQQVLDHVFFLSHSEWKRVREEEQFDYVIVGTGFCSLAFAKRILDKDPHSRILMIERGPFFLPEHFQNLPIPYQRTLGGLSETFPWTLSSRTANQPAGEIGWQHGMVPFFGGRSIMWSAWCPRPTDDELQFWPAATIAAVKERFTSAEALLNVIPADQIDAGLDRGMLEQVMEQRPVYAGMQKGLQAMLNAKIGQIDSATRWMPAPLAAAANRVGGVDFAKFSTPSPIMELITRQADLAAAGKGSALRVVTECVVELIHQQDGVATALQTSRGVVSLGDAKLVLAMGTLPPATLLMNSFPQMQRGGDRFTAHFITSVVARVPRQDFPFGETLAELELAAIYLAGKNPETDMQYHVQLSVLSDKEPEKNAQKAARYMPDVVATASMAQLQSSKDHLVFVCAVLGEIDFRNPDNFFHLNDHGPVDLTCNVTLQVLASQNDQKTWDTMDEGTFQMMEKVFSSAGRVEYWHGDPDQGKWSSERPAKTERRVPALVHEGSTLWLGEGEQGVVGLDYRPNGVHNVYVTGGGLWPASGSWNPTMTMVAMAQDLADQQLQQSSKP